MSKKATIHEVQDGSTYVMAIRLEKPMAHALFDLAKKEHRSRSAQVVHMIDAALKANGGAA